MELVLIYSKVSLFLWFCVEAERAGRATKRQVASEDLAAPQANFLCSGRMTDSTAHREEGVSHRATHTLLTRPTLPAGKVCLRLGSTDILEDAGLSKWLGQGPTCLISTPCFFTFSTPHWLHWMCYLWASILTSSQGDSPELFHLVQLSAISSQTPTWTHWWNNPRALCLICLHPSLGKLPDCSNKWTQPRCTFTNMAES